MGSHKDSLSAFAMLRFDMCIDMYVYVSTSL